MLIEVLLSTLLIEVLLFFNMFLYISSVFGRFSFRRRYRRLSLVPDSFRLGSSVLDLLLTCAVPLLSVVVGRVLRPRRLPGLVLHPPTEEVEVLRKDSYDRGRVRL